MKKITTAVIFLLLVAVPGKSQHIISFDMATIRNTQKPINGLNVSSFYFFNKHLAGGVEVNRFFPVTHKSAEEELQVSAWDIELNFHYLIGIYKKLNIYPITGISHTSDRELVGNKGISHYESFWSLNTGAGISWGLGNWSPHIEYSFAWGHHNQQFLLAGISYDIEMGRHHTKD